jgi:hypothetical protein
MSLTVRPYRRGGWEIDITTRMPNGSRYRERCKAPVSSKSAAQRWREDRERYLLRDGHAEPKKEVPTLNEFAPRFLEGASANRQKASTVEAKRSILTNHLLPHVGAKRLDAVTAEDVAQLKYQLRARTPKTPRQGFTTLRSTRGWVGDGGRRKCEVECLEAVSWGG